MRNPSYQLQTVRNYDPDLFALSLFVPSAHREMLLTLYALDVELAHVHLAVSEETIAHIRYAWWQEALQSIASGKPPREHPVLQAMPHAMIPQCLALVEQYRAYYPTLPPDRHIIEEISLTFIREHCAQAQPGWQKAKAIIDRHRARFGRRMNSWLHLKLLWVGVTPAKAGVHVN